MSDMMSRLPGIIFPSDRGPRTSATLLQVLLEVGTQPATIMLDAGDWAIAQNVTVSANVSLILLRGARFVIDAGRTLTLDGCELQAPPNEIFSGAGSVAGEPLFAFRHPVWGDVINFDIGEGYLNGDVNISGYMASPNEVDAGILDNKAVSPLTLRTTELTANQLPSHDNLRGVAPDQHRRIHVSAGVPTGGQDGDIWIQYS
jgi:hypothetical protein